MSANSPSDIEVLIWYHARVEPHERHDAPAVSTARLRFLEDGVIEPCDSSGSGYRTTERGRKWLRMILATPYPVQAWIDPREAAQGKES